MSVKHTDKTLERRLQILEMLATGHNYRDMAKIFGISHETARQTAYILFEELGADNAAHAIAIAYQRGYLKVICTPK